jgi:hypothetical protein
LRERRPAEEVITTHAATCPHCSRETRVGVLDVEVIVYGSCSHMTGVETTGDQVAILFQKQVA